MLWYSAADRRLTENARQVIHSQDSLVYISCAAVWEIEIKVASGKLQLIPGFFEALETMYDFILLPIDYSHARAVGRLPDYHKDPFDRIMIAQCQVEQLCFITHDENIPRYDVQVLKA